MTKEAIRIAWSGTPAWLVRRLGYWLLTAPRTIGRDELLRRVAAGPTAGLGEREAALEAEALAEELGRWWIAEGAPDPPPDG